MSTELEALVGHLFVIGGRALTSPSPGAVAMSPPRRPARGRDLDTFFGVVTMSGGPPGEPAAFYEQLSSIITGQYYATPGSITSALREAIATANASLLAENINRDAPTAAGLACAVLRGSEVIIANVGSARTFLQRADQLERLPTEEELAEQLPPLGIKEKPDVRFYRREVRAGDFLFIADQALNSLADGTLRQITSSRDIESSLSNLRDLLGDFASVMVIQFVTPLTEEEEIAQQLARQSQATEEAIRARSAAAPPLAVSQPAPSPQFIPETSDQQTPSSGGDIVRTVREGLRNAFLGIATATDSIRGFFDRALPEGKSSTPGMSGTLQVGIAIIIPILVALLTTGVYLARGEASQYSNLVNQARSELSIARAAGDDQATARPHWETALFLLEQAELLRPSDATLAQDRAEANSALDFYDSVTRVPLATLREYELDSTLRGPIVAGTDLYLIDITTNTLYREQLDETGHSILGRDPEVIARQDELLSDQVIGSFVDLEWMPEGGVPQRNVLAVLTDNGLLLTYSPTWALQATPLPGGRDIVEARSIAVYAGNFYVLDVGSNQIWRYEAIGDAYPDLPTPYFTESFPDLSGAVDLDIDSTGNLFVLYNDGSLKKYFGGQQEGFFLENLPQSALNPTSLYIDQNPFSPAFFITDPDGERLYQTTTTGIFSRNYKSSEDHYLQSLSGIFSDASTDSIYLIAGNSLYRFTRP